MREAAAELRPTFNLTFNMLATRFYKQYPLGCWLGPRIFDFEKPKIGGSIESFAERSTPFSIRQTGISARAASLQQRSPRW